MWGDGILVKQHKEQKKQTKLMKANVALSAAQLAAQRESNKQLALQSKLMMDEAAKKQYQKEVKALTFELRQAADNSKNFKSDIARYVAAKLVMFKVDEEGISSEVFEEIPDKTYFSELFKSLNQTITESSQEARTAGEKYLDDLAHRLGDLSLLTRLRQGAKNFPTFIGNLIPFPVLFLLSSATKQLWAILGTKFNVPAVKNFSEILQRADETATKLNSELNQYRNANYPEVSSLPFTGQLLEPAISSVPAVKSSGISKIAFGSVAAFVLLILTIAIVSPSTSDRAKEERQATNSLMPQPQQTFLQAVSKIETDAGPDAGQKLMALVQASSPFYGWSGELTGLETTTGKNLGFKLRVQGTSVVLQNFSGILATDDEPYIVRANTPLFASLSKLTESTPVKFSGSFATVPSATGKPSIKFVLSDIQPLPAPEPPK